MSETSPTEQVDQNAGSETDLPAADHQPSADEQQPESVSSGTQDTDQPTNDDQPQGTTGDDGGSSDDDDGLSRFAKAQGIDDLDDLSDRERKLLKTAHDNHKAFRNKANEDTDALRETLVDTEEVSEDELDDLSPEEANERKINSRFAQLEAKERSNEFFNKNPEARDFEQDMAQLLIDEAKNNGVDAARFLAKDLNRVLVLAKAARGDSTEQVRADAVREERERLRREQEGSADGGQASSSHTSSKTLTREDISKMPDEEYQKLRDSGELDKMIAGGQLY